MSDLVVGVADASVVDRLVDTLVAAHLDYIWERWAIRGAERRRRLTDAYRADLIDVGFPHGVVHADAAGDSVAVWLPGHADTVLDEAIVESRLDSSVDLFGERAAIVAEVDELVAAVLCPPADWYLATVGTRPERRRRGLASAVLQFQLDQIDERGETARLETSAPDNVGFYERRGFELVDVLELPHGAPTTTVMYRRPR